MKLFGSVFGATGTSYRQAAVRMTALLRKADWADALTTPQSGAASWWYRTKEVLEKLSFNSKLAKRAVRRTK